MTGERADVYMNLDPETGRYTVRPSDLNKLMQHAPAKVVKKNLTTAWKLQNSSVTLFSIRPTSQQLWPSFVDWDNTMMTASWENPHWEMWSLEAPIQNSPSSACWSRIFNFCTFPPRTLEPSGGGEGVWPVVFRRRFKLCWLDLQHVDEFDQKLRSCLWADKLLVDGKASHFSSTCGVSAACLHSWTVYQHQPKTAKKKTERPRACLSAAILRTNWQLLPSVAFLVQQSDWAE